MEIKAGNVETINTNGTGWIVGYSSGLESFPLRYMPQGGCAHTVGVKWMDHHTTDEPAKGRNKPVSEGRTMSILVSPKGGIQLEFCENNKFQEDVKQRWLEKHGDYVIWGEGICHQWSVEADSTVLTVRWVPI